MNKRKSIRSYLKDRVAYFTELVIQLEEKEAGAWSPAMKLDIWQALANAKGQLTAFKAALNVVISYDYRR